MIINRAYKFELKPNNKQKSALLQNAGVARFAWNWGLAERIKLYNTETGNNKFTDAMRQHKKLVQLKKTEYSWMYEVSKCTPQEALRDLDKAFKNFYRKYNGSKRKWGFPKFKKKNKVKPSFRLAGYIRIYGKNHTKYPRKTKLPRLPPIKLKGDCEKLISKIDRGIVRILSATLIHEANRWFVSYTVEEKFTPYEIKNRTANIGIDLGIKEFATLSNGIVFKNPKPLEKHLKQLARLNRSRSRMKLGSSNYKKMTQKIVKLHYKIRCIRSDRTHKITHYIVNNYERIVIEDLNVNGLMKNRRVSRALSDVSFREFRNKLEYKSQWYKCELLVADRFYPSSKKCSNCGVVKKKLSLSERIYTCNSCNTSIDRDLNAAINLSNVKLPVAVS